MFTFDPVSLLDELKLTMAVWKEADRVATTPSQESAVLSTTVAPTIPLLRGRVLRLDPRLRFGYEELLTEVKEVFCTHGNFLHSTCTATIPDPRAI